MGLTTEQLEARRAYLGGTDMAALAGLSPYAKPIDVWLQKTGQAPDKPSNNMMSLGSLLEPVVAGLFAEATGLAVRRAGQTALRDRHRPWLGGNVDRYTKDWSGRFDYAAGILECKWGMDRDKWGPSGGGLPDMPPARVPAGYAVQLQHYLGITGRTVGYMAALLGYADFRWYVLPRDDEAIEILRDLGTKFWHDNVLAGVPPEPDGSDSYGEWLANKWREDAGTEAVATVAQAGWWDEYWTNEDVRVNAERRRDEAAQHLKDSMTNTAKLLLPDGHILWRSYTERNVEWQAVAKAVAGRRTKQLRDAILAATTVKTKRPFRPKRTAQEEDDATS